MTARDEDSKQRRIVVGVDGSVPSKAALAWALAQARLTGATVEAVIAWEYPTPYGYAVPMPDDWEGLAKRVVTEAIAEAGPDAGSVRVTYRIREGNPARVLLEAADGADLLVVGSRGHGGFVEALLGSTGQHVVHHATCPVVVLRDSATGHLPGR